MMYSVDDWNPQRKVNTNTVSADLGWNRFHADEALACAMLRMTDRYKDAKIVRTRDASLLAKMDIVVDVGGEYSPAASRFDHHQPSFVETFGEGYRICLSSAGLIYKHFGKQVISKVAKDSMVELSSKELDKIFVKFYESFVESFDGIDNGVPMYPVEIKPAYHRPWDIFAQVDALNPYWNEEGTVDADDRFEQAVSLVGSNFVTALGYYLKAWLPSRSIVSSAIQLVGSIASVGSEPRILVLPTKCAWKEHLFELEEELGIPGQILFVVYPEGNDGTWRTQGVPVRLDSFELRKKMPEGWLGLRDEDLNRATGMSGCIFVHRGGFIGVHATREGAIKMAQLSV